MNILKQSIEAVIKQGEQSINNNGTCQYRHGELKCAIGHLITDEHYNESLEASMVNIGNKIHKALNKSLGYKLSDKAIDQLEAVQEAHDNVTCNNFVEGFKSRILRHINSGTLPQELRELVE